MSSSAALAVGAFVAVLLVLILVPLSFSYIDYYDYGLVQRKVSTPPGAAHSIQTNASVR